MPVRSLWVASPITTSIVAVILLFGTLVFSPVCDAQTQTASPSIQLSLAPEIARYVPVAARDVSVVLLSGSNTQWKVFLAAWNEQSRDSSDTTVIAAQRGGQNRKALLRFKVDGGYSPRLVVRSDFRYRGNPLAFIQTQFGAAAAQMDVVGVDGGTVRRLGSIEADYFDFVAIEETTYLVAHDDVNLFDVPRLYRWTGLSFADDSTNHPEFYKRLATEIRSKSDVAKFAPAVKLRYDQILHLSRERTSSGR